MTALCVTGYGSLDYAVTLDGFATADRTTLVSARDPAAWPRCGGCPAYVARAVASPARQVQVVSWMGDNAEGRRYCDGLAADGIDPSGIDFVAAPRSPTALLVYQADGSCACLYDPALGGRERLSETQRLLIAGASHLCVSVGPSQLMRPILEARSDGSRVYWLAKNDSAAFTPEICRLLSEKVDVVFCNSAERALVDATLGAGVVVETRGSEGVVVTSGGQESTIDVETVVASDTTGAGDTFAGAFIAAEMDGVSDPAAAAAQAAAAAGEFLRGRGTGGGR